MTAAMLHRTFTPDIELLPRAKGGDGRTVVGIAVPYDYPQPIPSEGIVEQFARGAFNAQIEAAHRIPYAREHLPFGGTLIGRVALLRDDAAGLYFEARISRTEKGDETLELIRDGALRDVSIGFREGQNRRLASSGHIERVTADLREIASVLEGAYGDAAGVAAVRHVEAAARARLGEAARQILAALPDLPADVL